MAQPFRSSGGNSRGLVDDGPRINQISDPLIFRFAQIRLLPNPRSKKRAANSTHFAEDQSKIQNPKSKIRMMYT
jgi:hypothetical protein